MARRNAARPDGLLEAVRGPVPTTTQPGSRPPSSLCVPLEFKLLSPTVFRRAGFRFYFFSREEPRVHIHVHHAAGEAKFWIDPRIELAQNHGLNARLVALAARTIRENESAIRTAWEEHFGG